MVADARGERRVWHLRATNFFGGPEKQIVGHLARLGGRWRPTLALFARDPGADELARRAKALGVRCVRLAGGGPFDPRQIVSLRRALRRGRADLLVTHGYRADIVGGAARLGGGPPQVTFVRGFTAENAHVRRLERLQRRVIRRAAAVACVSAATARAIVAGGVPSERVVAIPNAVEVPDRSATPHDGPARGRTIVAAGRLSPEKGHLLLLDAFATLGDACDATLTIWGEGAVRAELERRVRTLGLEGRVRLPGFTGSLADRLAEAAVLVNPSHSEGLPNVVLEALAVGTPVVATAVGGVPELLADAGCGRTVPPGDPAALAAALRDVLDDPVAALAAAARGRERIRRAYSFETQAARLVRLYDAVVERRPVRAAVDAPDGDPVGAA